MKSADIRESFLSFFESKGHTRVPSSSLVPANDPTLLFTNAGMNQFKDCFLGYEKRPYSRATSSQKCVRAGGKHNDLENVGYTARHHTFFEMLGNFSFGDYFKREAIHFAWEFLTSAERLALPPEKLWVTVYAEDDEAYRIWTEEVGVPASRLVRIGDNKDERYASDNFWAMGDTGPCGPCTEIFYDHGPEIWGGPPGSPDEDGDRYVEIWNLVFMQYNRSADGTMEPLPKPSVDTGMGLERIAAVMQGAHSNYDIDLFVNLVNAAAEVIGCPNNGDPSLRVLADHIRSCSFLIADGVLPSNEGRGFVLRRIIRRACRHGHKLGAKGEFFYRLVPALVAEMGDAFPELKTQQTHIERALRSEEELFAKTLDKGLKILDQELIELPGKLIPGALVFKLSDTYGFPADLTNDIARERGFSIDEAGFEQEMQAQRERARSASNFTADYGAVLEVQGETRFLGYQSLTGGGAVVALLIDGHAVDGLMEGQDGVVVLGQTPFYGQSGGQVGDRGYLEAPDVLFEVTDTTKSHGVVLHHGRLLKGCLRQGSSLAAKVNAEWRQAISLNHSATHLLHAALRKILGTHVHQKGSLVNSQRLRFDFSHFEPVSTAQLQAIESLVNSQVRANSQVQTEVTDIQTAKAKGAIALFDEKYSDQVRVLTMGDGFSVELCGGTHVARTGDIGLFKIVSESSVQSGVRRIEALTGGAAVAHVAAMESQLHQLAGLLKSTPEGAEEKLTSLLEANRQLDREVQQFKARAASDAGDRLADSAQDIQGIKVLAARLDDAEGDTMMKLVDQLKNKLGSAVVLLASVQEDKVILVAGVTQNLTDSFKAGDLIKQVAPLVGGKGGGRPDMARGGGNNPAGLDEALQQAVAFVQEQV